MATPWDRITDETYMSWLINRQVTLDEFNGASLVERSTLRTQFEQQQQQQTVPEEYKQLAAFAKQKLDNRTKHKLMSEASIQFAGEILMGYGFRCVVDRPIKERGSTADPPPYSWKVVDSNSVAGEKGEHAGTPGARDWARAHLLGVHEIYDFKVVTGALLPTVKANQRSSSGKGDLAIGNSEDLLLGEEYLFANGLVELKTDEYPLNTGQNLLQLLALSKISAFETGVALLATNCSTQWETFHFSDVQTIRRRIYTHGRKAWEDFMALIKSPEKRVFAKTKALKTVMEVDEQNLDGFDLGDRDSTKIKATTDEATLERLAEYFGDLYGERPVVPFWARAESRVPDYYA